MIAQKFQIGDMVRVRPFEMIDREDIGTLTYIPASTGHNGSCYSIPLSFINKVSASGPLFIVNAMKNFDTYIYGIKNPDGEIVSYYWAQGMLEPAYAYDDHIEIPDKDLFLSAVIG